jgi:ribose transport system ATP-binding protein
VSENLAAPAIRFVTPWGWRHLGKQRAIASEIATRFQISKRRLGSRVNTLSGGNQQKVALGKFIGARPRVLLIDEPTRGVDVGARAEIYGHLRRLADDGLAIVFASTDIREAIGLADRVSTFYRGHLISTYDREEADVATVTRDITHLEPGQVMSSTGST